MMVHYQYNEPKPAKSRFHVLFAVVIFILTLALWPSDAYGLDAPGCDDPWYFQSDASLMFMVPDKAQHYWGSYGLASFLQPRLGCVAGGTLAFIIGTAWEVKDSYTDLGTPGGGTVGFSYRDLIADGLGVLSATLDNDQWHFYVDYSTVDETITLNATLSF